MRPTLMSAAIDDDARDHGAPLACHARDDAAVRQGKAGPSDGVVLEVEGVGCTYFHKDKFLRLTFDEGVIMATQALLEGPGE